MASAPVNVPVNEDIKERDINNKLQLFGIYSAFASGKVPSNAQIDVALNSALASKPLANPSTRLSPEGVKLIEDLKDVIEKAKLLVLTKNEGDLLQDFVWQTQQISGGDFAAPGAPVNKETAKQQGAEALDGLRTLGTLILSNGQFRKLLSDSVTLLRSIAGDAATSAAGRVNPSDDKMKALDDAAADNTWHTVPKLSDLTKQAKDAFNKNKPFGKADIEKAAGGASEAAHPDGIRDPAATAHLAAQDQQTGTASGVDAQSGAVAGAERLKDAASANIDESTKNKDKEYRDRSTAYLKSIIPQERREQIIWRLKKMVIEIQGHQDYLRAVDTLLRLAEEYTGHTKTLAGQGSSAVKGAHTDNSLTAAEADLKTLIERLANSTSLDDLFESINQIYREAEKDPQLKAWFTKMNAYIRKCLKEQGFIMQDGAKTEWDAIYEEGDNLLRKKYRSQIDRVADEFKFIGKQFDEDPMNKAFGLSVQKLFLDLGQDETGHHKFKPHLLKDLSEVIIPAIFENIRYVPIPRIEVSDPQIDAVVENLVLEGDNLAPNMFEFSNDNYFRWGRKTVSTKNKNKVMVSVSGIQADLRDVAYYVKKKQGFPSITDRGVMDIHLGGEGFSFKIEMETADKSDRQHFFKINKIKVDVKHLSIKPKQSDHKLLLLLAKPLLLKVLRPVIQKVAEKQLKANAVQLDAFMWQIHQEAKKAQADFAANPDPDNAKNIYHRYAEAVNTQIMQGKAKTEQVKSEVKVNVAVTAHESMFPDVKLPGGISTKATEYKDLAAKGDKWESPVFSLGSAKETAAVEKPQAITRRRAGAPAAAQNLSVGASGLSSQMDQAFTNGNKAVNGGPAAASAA